MSETTETDPRVQVAIDRQRNAPKGCVCAFNLDGSVTKSLCPLHADIDPCLKMSWVTGRRRTGTIRRGVCTACGHGAKA